MGREGARGCGGGGGAAETRGCGSNPRSARGLITFALGFIPVYSNLSVVAGGSRRAAEERPGGMGRGRGVDGSGRDGARQKEMRESREREMGRDAGRDTETRGQGWGAAESIDREMD